jgi:release factor glutamine methyltransferase
MLAEYLRREPRIAGARVLDLCTGSGMLAVVAAQVGAATVTAVDVSRRSLLSARLTARLNGVRVAARRGDLFSVVSEARFDLIITNPPYVPSRDDALPRRGASRAWEAGPRGRAFIDRICAQAAGHLDPGRVLLLIQSSVCEPRAKPQLDVAGDPVAGP